MKQTIHLGYEVGTGEAVEVPVRHMAVTGQTQESGKTTTLEALISRSELTAIAFITKRGEGSFHAGHQIKPFFQERVDAEFVSSVLESTRREKMKFERAWIYKACKGAKSLSQVRDNCHSLQKKSNRSLDQDMYMLLGEYLDKVVPLIASLPKAPDLGMKRGLNVMDLSRYPLELQMLVISSTLQRIYEEHIEVITIIPEAWELVPQGRNTPVKLIAEKLVRKGAGLGNYVWLDSQDMAAVDKLLLRACAVWLVGVQREANEVKRALGNMPAGMKTPKPADVAGLDLGQFFLAQRSKLQKVYVQPAWMMPNSAVQIALGDLSVTDFAAPTGGSHAKVENAAVDGALQGNDYQHRRQLHRGADDEGHRSSRESSVVNPGGVLQVASGSVDQTESGQGTDSGVQQTLASHQKHIGARGPAEEEAARPGGEDREEEEMPKQWTEEELMARLADDKQKPLQGLQASSVYATVRALIPILNGVSPAGSGETKSGAEPSLRRDATAPLESALDGAHQAARLSRESLKREIIDEIRKDPVLIRLSQEKPAIEVQVAFNLVKMDGSSYVGRIATLIHDGFFAGTGQGYSATFKELVRRGMSPKTPNVRISQALSELTAMGFFHRGANKEYICAPGADVRVVAA